MISTQIYESSWGKLNSGIIVGHTTKSTAKLWVRTYRPGIWWLILCESPIKGADLVRLEEQPVKDYLDSMGIVYCAAKKRRFENRPSDQTGTFAFVGLKPATRYYYYLIADDLEVMRRTEIGFESTQWFRTLEASPKEVRFGFYSCHDPFSVTGHGEGLWANFYQLLCQRKADFVIGGGDQVYVDTNRDEDMPDMWKWLRSQKLSIIENFSNPDGSLKHEEITDRFVEIYHQYYRFYWAFPNLQKTYKAFPQYMVWDDHEIMDGWGSLTKDERNARLNRLLQDDDNEINEQLVDCIFKAAITAYDNYQHSHNPTTPGGLSHPDSAVWDYGFHYGAFSFYALDMRGHHDFESETDDKLLGIEQMERFFQWVDRPATRRSKFVFIISPVPLVHWNETLANWADFGSQKDDFRDEWGHESNHKERNCLLKKMLFSSHYQDQTVVFLSGDVHSASAFRILQPKEFSKARVYNITSSAISRKPAPRIAQMGIAKNGPIPGYEVGRFEKMYQSAGYNNFAYVRAHIESGKPKATIELFRSGGDDGELVVRSLEI